MTDKNNLNIGIIGNRDLTNKNIHIIKNTLNLLIRKIISTTSTCEHTCDNNSQKQSHSVCYTINMINSLAEGADQLAACVINEMDAPIKLICPIPFKLSQYRSTLTTNASKLTFDELLNSPELSSKTIEMKLPFESDELKNKGYQQAAKKLLELSDFIIALYDPSKTGHTGGTKETINFAMQNNIPVVHLNINNPSHIAISSSYTQHKINYQNITTLKTSELQSNIPCL